MFQGPETESENCQTMWKPSSLVKPSPSAWMMASPRSQSAERRAWRALPPSTSLRALQVLEGVDGFDFGQVVREPFDAALRLAVAQVFEEVGDLVLAERAIEDGVALEDGDFDLVFAGEQEGFPVVFLAVPG